MTKRIIVSIVLFIFLINTYVYAQDYSFSARIINSGNKKYKAVKLIPQIYNNTREDLADLEIFDDNNEPVPYFINRFSQSRGKKSYEMELINSFVEDVDNYCDYALKSPQNEDIIATSIEVKSDSDNFAMRIVVYGSFNNENWEKIQEDVIYNVDDNNKLEIAFDSIK